MNNENLIIKLVSMLLENTEITGGQRGNKTEAVNKQECINFIGKKVIIRSRDAGVHFGTLIEDGENHVVLENSRRLDRFYIGGNEDSLSGVARHGILKNHKDSRISGVVSVQKIVNHCEIIIIENSDAAQTIEQSDIYTKG